MSQFQEEVFLLLFGMGQELAEMSWDSFVEQGVPGLFGAGQGHSHIQCRSESGARRRGQRALMILACGSWVYSAYREPSTFQPVMSFRIVVRRA